MAALNGDLTVVESLLMGDKIVLKATAHVYSPLIAAALNGHLAVVEALLKGGASVNEVCDGTTGLLLA